MSQDTLLLVSYMRSGNHLFRSMLEFAFSRPTLGTGNTAKDGPIHLRKPNQTRPTIIVSNSDPISVKAHRLGHVTFWLHDQATVPTRAVLLLRDPVEAITSQLLRSFGTKLFFTDRKLSKSVKAEVNKYLEPVFAYMAFPPQSRFVVRFEDMVGQNGLTCVNNALVRLGSPRQLTATEFADVSLIAKSSQKSLSRTPHKTRQRVLDAVREQISEERLQVILDQMTALDRPTDSAPAP